MAAAGSEQAEIRLAAGRLRLEVADPDPEWPLDRLCGFASRRNRRRGFLIVSKVLGRHVPVSPKEMRAAARALAERISPSAPEPLLVVGLAETAVALGQTVFAELLRLGRGAFFIHSTRQETRASLLCRFEEPHSHASAHLIYRPSAVDLGSVRTLVLVDDEVSTGTTLRNLAAVLMPALPRCERIVVATLTHWADRAWLADMPRPAGCAALLEGDLAWVPDAAAEADEGDATPPGALGKLERPGPFGRLGIAEAAPFSLPVPPVAAGAPLRVVGTGEFTYPPFLLAERLEQAGHDVVVQATSRSPVRLGGAIGTALAFTDNYGTGVPNYLYNAAPGDGRLTLVCHETPPGSVDPRLIEALSARPLFFGDVPCAR